MYDSKTVDAAMRAFDLDTLVITRDADSGTVGILDETVVFDGPVDFDPSGGSTYTNPAGLVDTADAVALVTPDASGTLPTVRLTDRATIAGDDYNIVSVTERKFTPRHLEIQLKRGPLREQQRVK